MRVEDDAGEIRPRRIRGPAGPSIRLESVVDRVRLIAVAGALAATVAGRLDNRGLCRAAHCGRTHPRRTAPDTCGRSSAGPSNSPTVTANTDAKAEFTGRDWWGTAYASIPGRRSSPANGRASAEI